jgi:HK97 family phage major capsid protein
MSKIKRDEIELSALARNATVEGTPDVENRTVEVVFGTEHHVLRYDWRADQHFWEELGFAEGEVRTARLESGVPILDNHNQWSGVRGVFGKATGTIDGKQGTATMRFSSREDVEPVFRDVLDGILDTVSVGYRVNMYRDTGKKGEKGYPIYRAVDWEPMEISLAPVPADPGARVRTEGEVAVTVTIERTDDNSPPVVVVQKEENPAPQGAKTKVRSTSEIVKPKKEFKMKDLNEMKAERAQKLEALTSFDNLTRSGESLNEEQATRQSALVNEIDVLDKAIATEEKRLAILASRASGGETQSRGEEIELRTLAKRASLHDALQKREAGKNVDGVWKEMTEESQRMGFGSDADISIPTKMITALRTGTADNFQIDAGQGSAFRPTEVPSFIEKLFAPFIFERLGATVLTGLTGEQQFPRQKTHGTAGALTEVAGASVAGLELDELKMNARRYAATTKYSKKMMVQSPLEIENRIANLLRAGFERKIEFDGFTGATGGENIVGIFNQSGINSPTITDGTAHAANTAALYRALIDSEAPLASVRYVMSSLTWQLWSRAPKITNIASLIDANGQIDGVPAFSAHWLANATATAGRAIVGDFSEAIFGYWGSFDLVIDPFTLKKNNQVELSGNMFVDLGLANPNAFAVTDEVSAT